MRTLVACCVALAACATLATPTLGQNKLNCADSTNHTQADMNQCARMAHQAADAELNAAWAQLRDRRGEGHSWDTILEAQRLWIPFRDAHCEAEAAPYEGGSIQPLIQSSCLAGVTRQRTEQLIYLMQLP